MSTPSPVDHNDDKWVGFFLTEQAAQDALDRVVKQQSINFTILCAKKEVMRKKKDAYFLFKFTVLKAPKENN